MYILESKFHGQRKLSRHWGCHTTGIDELRILTIQLLVSIDQKQVGSLQLNRQIADWSIMEPSLREVVSQRNLLHTDEVTLCYTLR